MKNRILSIALAVTLIVTAIFMPLQAGATAPSYSGIDVYEGTGVINWSQVATQTQFCWIKFSEGENYVDSRHTLNVTGTEAAGVKWGPYEFLRLYSPESCKRQADNFWARISAYNYTVLPAVDVETYDNCTTSDQVRACLRAFVDEFKAQAGFTPIIYSYTYYITHNGLAAGFTDCKLWQADYRGYVGDTGWAGGWVAWQYSSQGVLPGINHLVDMSKGTDGIFITRAPQPIRPITPAPATPKVTIPATYRVQSGDTLCGIAGKYGLKWTTIAQINGIKLPYIIRVGQVIKLTSTIPNSAAVPAATQTATYYTVKSGDCLSTIAAKYKTTYQAIAELNGIKAPYTIYPGRKLRVR